VSDATLGLPYEKQNFGVYDYDNPQFNLPVLLKLILKFLITRKIT